jgi:hypothetical protein
MKDEVIRELWKIKDAIGARNNYDVRLLVENLRAKQRAQGARVIDLHARQHTESRTAH